LLCERACVFGNRKLLDCFLLSFARGGCLETPFVHPIRLPKLRKRAAYGKWSEITILVATKSRDFTVLQVVPESLSLSLSHPCLQYFTWKTKDRVVCWLRTQRERETFLHIPTYFYWDKLIRYSLICRINLCSIYFRVSRKNYLVCGELLVVLIFSMNITRDVVLKSGNTYENLAQSLKKVLRFWGLACGGFCGFGSV
jgi:hypothetical protein